MAEHFEEFDDYKVAVKAVESENMVTNTIIAKELTKGAVQGRCAGRDS